jgi:hypothetical protein
MQRIRENAGLSVVAFAVAALPAKGQLTPRSVSPSAARTLRWHDVCMPHRRLARHRAHSPEARHPARKNMNLLSSIPWRPPAAHHLRKLFSGYVDRDLPATRGRI